MSYGSRLCNTICEVKLSELYTQMSRLDCFIGYSLLRRSPVSQWKVFDKVIVLTQFPLLIERSLNRNGGIIVIDCLYSRFNHVDIRNKDTIVNLALILHSIAQNFHSYAV